MSKSLFIFGFYSGEYSTCGIFNLGTFNPLTVTTGFTLTGDTVLTEFYSAVNKCLQVLAS